MKEGRLFLECYRQEMGLQNSPLQTGANLQEKVRMTQGGTAMDPEAKDHGAATEGARG